jgi:hypothetical protein
MTRLTKYGKLLLQHLDLRNDKVLSWQPLHDVALMAESLEKGQLSFKSSAVNHSQPIGVLF